MKVPEKRGASLKGDNRHRKNKKKKRLGKGKKKNSLISAKRMFGKMGGNDWS